MRVFYSIAALFALILLLSATVSSPVNAQVIPTDQWINFYSSNTIFHGGTVPVGAIIDAYDPDGVHCGTFTVTTEGKYGFLIVYRDDVLTETVDEGALPGDSITFTINSVPVKTWGPDPNVWTENGATFQVDLADNLSPTIISPIADVITFEDEPDSIITDLDTVFSDPDNDLLIYTITSNSSDVLSSIDTEHQVNISLTPDWFGDATLIISAQDAWFTIYDTVHVQVMSVNDPPEIRDLPDISFSSDTTITIDLNKYVEDVDHVKSSLHWTAEVQPPYGNALQIEIDNATKIATFSAAYFFSANVEVIFTVTDDSLATDTDNMFVQVNLPEAVENDGNLNRPKSYSLSHNYPNPFNSATSIHYQLPQCCHVTLKVLNSLGQQVAILVDKEQESGSYTIHWDASDQASGVYLMSFETVDFKQLQKMILLR